MSSRDTEFSWRFAILFYLCCPVLIVFAAHERYDQKRKAIKPLSLLPPTRKRALSIQLGPNYEPLKSRKPLRLPFRQAPKPCLFLEKLPVEIREMIYIEAMGGHLFRIERRKKNLGHVTCQHSVDVTCSWNCSMYGAVGRGQWPEKKIWKGPGVDPDANLLALAKTCRKIYSESIDILYSHNTFHIPQWKTLCDFSSSILPQRLMALQTLHIKLLYRSIVVSKMPCHQIWDQIAEIPRLETLKILISGGFGDYPLDAEAEGLRLQPLMVIKKPRVFQIETTWPVKGEYPDAPFKISTGQESISITYMHPEAYF